MNCNVFIGLALTLAGGHGGNGSMSDGESNNSTVSSLLAIPLLITVYLTAHCLLLHCRYLLAVLMLMLLKKTSCNLFPILGRLFQ